MTENFKNNLGRATCSESVLKSKHCWHLQYYKKPLVSGVCQCDFLLSLNNISLLSLLFLHILGAEVGPVSWHSDVSFRRCQFPVAFRVFNTCTNICSVHLFLFVILFSFSIMQIYPDDWNFWNTHNAGTDARRHELPHSVSFGLLFFWTGGGIRIVM